MARLTYLERRKGSGSYYARIDIPVDLVEHFGTTTRKLSLRTKDELEAKRLLPSVIEKWNAEFDDVRARRALTPDDKVDAVWGHYVATLDRYEETRRHLPTQAEIDEASREMFARVQRGEITSTDPLAMLDATLEVKVLQERGRIEQGHRRIKLDAMRKHLADNDPSLIAHEVTDYLNRQRLMVAHDSDDRRELARQMARAEIEALERTLERDHGDYSGMPKDPIVKPANGAARASAMAGERIMDLFADYERENPNSVAPDTLNQARRDISTFVDYVGSTCPVTRIDKRSVREWKKLLTRYPVKASETKAFAGMKIAQIVRANETIGKPVLTARTVNRYLSSLGAFCNWLVAHGHIDANPCEGMSLPKKKGRSTFPFSSEQLNELFASPLFTGCQNEEEWRFIAKPGNVLIRDHRFWVPLIMLFSGARPGELAQLNISDVRQEHGVWIMHVTTEGEGDKTVKTEGSMRVLPVHSELIRLGFLKHHERMKAEGHSRLFPEATRNSRGQWIADTSREFGRYLTRLGIKKGRGLSLYSFRHGATDALRRAGYLDEQFGFILGHVKGSTTGRYGIMPQGMLQQRVELVEAIAYPGLSIEHLC